MTNISWSQFEKNQLAKDVSFESFCFQVAYILFKDYGFFENYYNTPGSEFYLTLHKDCPELNLKAGDEVGWQVKWWFENEENTSLTKVRRGELVKGFTTTLTRHPNIKLWIICSPGKFVEDTFNALKTELNRLSPTAKFTYWNKAVFDNFLSNNFEKFGAVFSHYFNATFIGFNFIKEYSKRRIDDLKKKFDTDLYTPSHYDDEILFIIDYKKIFAELEIRIKYLQDDINKIEKDDLFTKDDYESFTKEYIQKVYGLLNLSVNTSKKVIEVITSKMNIAKGKLLYDEIQKHIKEYREIADFLNKKIKSKEHLVKEDEENQIEEHYHRYYIIDSIKKINEHLISNKEENKANNCIYDLLISLLQKDIHILSSAGYGKTNIACNICNTCLQENIPCLLILGSNFRKSELPQTIILEQLGLNNKYTFKELLQALNTLGFTKGVKIPIIIDGLNESKPYDGIWRTHIKDIIRDIYNLENVILITTCRDRYIESIFEETDVSKIPNTKTLVGLADKVRDKAIKKYFHKYNIVPSSWNFNKELFENPLLLKIFSEVSENKTNIHISLENVFNSIDSYINLIEEKASLVNSAVDGILRIKIKSRIEEFCRVLWNSNKREISLEEFHKIIDPENPSLTDSLTVKLLDEGLCFQRNLAIENETVQFTYDLVGGYSITSKVLLKSISINNNVVVKLKELRIAEKLFNKETEHPLRQDILMSLLHLLPVKFGINLFELFDNESVIEECFNSVDYFIGNKIGQEKLLQIISKEKKDSRNFKLLFEKLFENIFKKEIHGLCEFTINILSNLNQSEIDIFWTELIRKNRPDVYQILSTINKSYSRNKNENGKEVQDLNLSFLSTTSSDKSIRSLATENLFLISNKYPDEILKLARQVLGFNDLNSIESVIVAICGSVLSLKNKKHTQNCLEFIVNEFLPNFTSTHICIIDNILTIAEFSKINFGIDYFKSISFNKKHFIISKDKTALSDFNNGHSIHFPALFGLDLYDFNKYQINGIASDGYKKRKTYSSVECLAIISDNIKRKGYDESLFDSIKKDFQEDNRYKYGRGENDNLTVYPEKYLWQSYFEFVGFLVLSNKLKSEGENRFRCDYNYFDPTFPHLPQRFQIVTECFFPQKNADVQEWINSDKQDYIDNYLLHNLNTEYEWVLLSLGITQECSENDTRFILFLDSFLIPSDRINNFQEQIDRKGYHHNSNSFYNLYAGEINWSPFAQRTVEGYDEKRLGLLDLMYEYTWTSWTSNRFQNPYFKFLNPKLSNLLGLTFNTDDLSFYDKRHKQVTKIVWTEHAKLYYVKKEIIEEVISKLKLELVWYQFISKYGAFGKHQDNKLNPTYKDLRQLIKYVEISKKE